MPIVLENRCIRWKQWRTQRLSFIHEDEVSVDLSGFKVLENVPQGTKAKVYVTFDQALSAKAIKE